MANCDRHIDFSRVRNGSASLRRALLRFAHGVRGERKTSVARAQILAWFRGTPAEFVEAALLAAVTVDEINVCSTALVKRNNARYVYELTEKGRAAMVERKAPSSFADHAKPGEFAKYGVTEGDSERLDQGEAMACERDARAR